MISIVVLRVHDQYCSVVSVHDQYCSVEST